MCNLKIFICFKELEKIAPKEKGITMQSVKEVVQNLVDDHLVDSEKIGTSIYFWSFPRYLLNYIMYFCKLFNLDFFLNVD